jgi:hypothetical protein
MRATVFFVFLCSLFLFNRTHAVINKAHFYSVSDSSSHNQKIDQPCSLSNSADWNRIIEESDLDSSEENNNNSNFNKSNKIVALSNGLVNQWEIEFLGEVVLQNSFKGFKNFKPYAAYSQPLYILQRVLRI